MVEIDPIELKGPWHKGFALDLHTLSAEFLGYNESGYPQYDTTYSPIGDLLYHLKYRNDRSTIDQIVEATTGFLRTWKPDVDLLVPVPATRERASAPVDSLARALAKAMDLQLCEKCVLKIKKTGELKSVDDYDERVELLKDAFKVDKESVKGRKILLFDDLYRSGATLEAITSVLYSQGETASVFVLTITKTRSRT